MSKTVAGARARTKGPEAPGAVTNGRRSSAKGQPSPAELARVEHALQAAAAGDFSVRLPAKRRDGIGRVEAAYNALAERNAALEAELVRVSQIIGREGRMTERASLDAADGGWATSVDSVNGLIDDLVRPTTEVARVIVA